MVNINLIPEKIRSAESLKLIVMIGIASLLIPVLFWGWRYQGKHSELSRVEKNLEALNAELKAPDLQGVVKEVEQFTQDQSALDSKRSVVDLLRKRQVLLLKLLDMLPDFIPGGGRIKTLTVTDGVKGVKKVMMVCEFVALDAMASVYENLEASSLVNMLELTGFPDIKIGESGRVITTATLNFELVDQP